MLSMSIVKGVTAAKQIAISPGIVHPPHAEPKLVFPNPFQRVSGLLTPIGMLPTICNDLFLGMWGIL